MKLIAFPLVGVATLAGVVAFTAPAANQEGAPIFVTDIPPGYRDWRLISVAHEEGNFLSLWSRTQKNTPQRAVGVSLTFRTANLATRRS